MLWNGAADKFGRVGKHVGVSVLGFAVLSLALLSVARIIRDAIGCALGARIALLGQVTIRTMLIERGCLVQGGSYLKKLFT